MLRNILLLSLIFTFSVSCDLEEFTGYRVSSVRLSESVQISGRVTNYYTDDPVYLAHIRIGAREVFTDYQGKFFIQYVLSESEKRNKPTTVEISADKYFPFKDKIYLSGMNNNFDFSIKYAAPIVKNTVLVETAYLSNEYYCQAIVMDYQGIHTVNKVVGVFFSKEYPKDSLQYPLKLRQTVSQREGYYQVLIRFTKWKPTRYYIKVNDRDGYEDRLWHGINPYIPDEFLFDPLLN
ncbi:MAG: hypothetical protein GXO77_01645 [Calditrichaeota bacterium]|nr:hypothetical protein [Calditrichota bacterium]